MNTLHETNAGNLRKTRATCIHCSKSSERSTPTVISNAIQTDTHADTRCQLCKKMARWNDKGRVVCKSEIQKDQVRNDVIHRSPPNKTSSGRRKVGNTCSKPEGIYLNKKPRKNTTGNEKPSGSCVRACHKCRKQCPFHDRPSRSVIRPSNNGKVVSNGMIPKSGKMCTNCGFEHGISRVKNNNNNRSETTKSPVGNEKKTCPQKSSKPAVTIIPTRPETINGVELAEKMCDLTNIFFMKIGTILSVDIPRVENRKGTA
jgi:hypothetical protein